MNDGGAIGLATIITDPSRLDGLDVAQVGAIVLELAAVQARLAGRLALLASEGRDGARDRLLTLPEASALLRTSPTWLRRRGGLPFVVKLSTGATRFSEQGLRRWISRKTGGR